MTQRQAAIILIAMVAHNVNKAYCDSIGDTSQKVWDESPEWQKESAIAGVEAQLANPDMTPEQRHNSWYDHKVADGWKYGQVKDAEKKTHPCLVGYCMLPEKERVKDYLFGAVVSSLVPEFAAALSDNSEVGESGSAEAAAPAAELAPAPTTPADLKPATEEVKADAELGNKEPEQEKAEPAPADLGPGIFEEESYEAAENQYTKDLNELSDKAGIGGLDSAGPAAMAE